MELKFLAEIDTYRFMKWRELPLLRRCAANLGYSFENKEETEAVKRLNDHLFQKISLVARPNSTDTNGKNQKDKLRFVAWSHMLEDDPVVEVLSRPWTQQIMTACREDAFTKDLLALTAAPKREEDPQVHQLTKTYKKAILAKLPKIGEQALLDLQRRYDQATVIVSTEEKKSDMLTGLLG